MSVASITVDYGGANYAIAPYVFLFNDDLDPNGCAVPSSSSGIILPSGMTSPIAFNGTVTPTDPIAVLGTTSDVLTCRWAD